MTVREPGRRHRLAAGLVVALLAAVTFAGWASPQSLPGGAPHHFLVLSGAPLNGPIPLDHIVVVMQENHVYDSYFGSYCLLLGPYCSMNGTGLPPGICVPLDPTTPSRGCQVPFLNTPANVTKPLDLLHNWQTGHQAYDNGSLDGFWLAEGKHLATFGHYDGSEIPTYWDMAEQYGLGDNFYASVLSYSTPNHWYLVAGTSPAIGVNQTLHRGSNLAALTKNETLYLNSANQTPTVQDLLVNSSASWKYYDWSLPTYQRAIQGVSGAGIANSAFDFWNPLAARSESYSPSMANHFVNRSQFFVDAENGALPNVSWVLPTFINSDHPNSSLVNGESWVAQIVNAVESSPDWNRTAIFVTWDDYGGYYDHLPPPPLDGNGVSFRAPLLVIGPYVRENYISHHFTYFESILRLMEWRFHLGSLTARDANAPLPLEYFDFNATPRAPITVASPPNAIYPQTLQPLAAPLGPQSLSASAAPAAVTLNWTASTGGTAVGTWGLTYGPATNPTQSRLRVDGSLSTTTVFNLLPGVLYQFSLSAQTGASVSAPSTVTATPAAGSTGAPPNAPAAWSRLPIADGAAVPPARTGASFVYDAKDQVDLLFGGLAPDGSYLGDTWEYLNGQWLHLTLTPTPGPRAFAGIAYSTADSRVVLFGGQSGLGFKSDTWGFVAGKWTNMTAAAVAAGPVPSARGSAVLTYESTYNYVMLFGGHGPSNTVLSDTWKFVKGKWTQFTTLKTVPPARWGASSTYDTLDSYIVVYGGNSSTGALLNDTWRFAGGSWKKLTISSANPGPRFGAAAVYDSVDQYVVLYGGWTAAGASSDTWRFASGGWTKLLLSGAPAARGYASVAFDKLHLGVILGFGSSGPSGPGANDVYEFAPPLQIAASASPTNGAAPLLATFSPTVQGGLVPYRYSWSFGDGGTSALPFATHVFRTPGSFLVGLSVTDALGISTTVPVSVGVRGTLSVVPQVVGLPGDGVVFSFSAAVGGGFPPYAYAWTFGDGGTSSAGTPTHTYQSAGSFPVTASVTDSIGGRATGVTTVLAALPDFEATIVATSVVGLAPLTINFTASTQGGSAPFAFAWDFDDEGPTTYGASASHAFPAAGDYDVSLIVSDSYNVSAYASVEVSVDSPMTMRATVSPLNGTAPLPVNLSASVVGGRAPFVYQWVLGDGNTSYLTVFSHTFQLSGNYSVALTVTDALGYRNSSTFTVNASGGSGTFHGLAGGPAPPPLSASSSASVASAPPTPPQPPTAAAVSRPSSPAPRSRRPGVAG